MFREVLEAGNIEGLTEDAGVYDDSALAEEDEEEIARVPLESATGDV